MDKPTCCYCGDTENLHPYGQTDPGFDKDPTATSRATYACNTCDPLSVTRTKIEDLAYALIGTCGDPSCYCGECSRGED